MEAWDVLLNILIVLTAAFLFGTAAERLRQNAIVGYLLAGTLVGPHGLGLVQSAAQIDLIAELGVALLLFGIGLEFSFRRLVSLGRMAIVGGAFQVLLTALAGALAGRLFGLAPRPALFVGAMVALSSTACVLRVLGDRTALDSAYGRNAVGILLLQDVAVVPLTLVLSLAGREAGPAVPWTVIARNAILVVATVGGVGFLLGYAIPRLLIRRPWGSNRELPILLAIVIATGSAILAHGIGFSPAIGAFIAGMFVAESPLAAQVRADVGSLRATFLTLFFASVGMLAEPRWIVEHAHLVGGTVCAIVVVKAILVWIVAMILGCRPGVALATGLCLAQVGEFSFVFAEIGRSSGILSPETFRLLVASTIATLIVTPYLVAVAPRVARRMDRFAPPSSRDPDAVDSEAQLPLGSVLIVGFGPAGRRVAEALLPEYGGRISVVDFNPQNAETARRLGIEVHVGDAQQPDLLIHSGIRYARAVVVTLPDFAAARHAIEACRDLNPEVHITARGRHHRFAEQLTQAGANAVIDEESEAGLRLASSVRRELGLEKDNPPDPVI
ncbi:cation:proton antiporter [Candidatus Sumerlaeota bacterium]|nr:cation:proton antiporter [Candidatus Sumerlaeota bacterium]